MPVDRSYDGLRQLLADRPRSGPEDLAALAMAVAPAIGATELVIYLADYGQNQLVPLRAADTPAREPIAVEGTVAGRAFASELPYETGQQIWVPLLDAAQRIGVLEIVASTAPPAQAHLLVAAAIAQLVSTRRFYGDAVEHSRRTLPMQVPTEIVWGLLPPLTY